MNWEMPDRNWFKIITPSLAFGFLGLALLAKFFVGRADVSPSYEKECQDEGGEWLLNAEKPTCVFPGGRLVYFGEVQQVALGEVAGVTEETEAPVGTVVAADDQFVPAVDPAPECGFGQVGEFQDFPVTDFYKGRSHRPDFDTYPEASQYRTAITKDVARGVNFAGAYVLSTWGRPERFNETKTVGFAIVDARDGRILAYGPSAGQPNDSGVVLDVDFQKDSRFFRVHSSIGPVAELISEGQVLQCGRY